MNDNIMYTKLDVKNMIAPILENYNSHVLRFHTILTEISCELIYDGPADIHDFIRDKTCYCCSVKWWNGNKKLLQQNSLECVVNKKCRLLKNVFPIMIGSNLDLCIRKKQLRSFTKSDLKFQRGEEEEEEEHVFELLDIASTFFIINGCVRQLPYFYTNDPTNTHIVKKKIVRCYAYDSDDKGKELSLYFEDVDNYKRGDMVIVLNDGSKNVDLQNFFDFCPYPIHQEVYMSKIFQDGHFNIDHLANKIIVSPGHLFVKLFLKYLYRPLIEQNWAVVKSKTVMITKSIESGSLLHVLSRKTLYFKESNYASPKMVQTPKENHRELGNNGEVYVEKNIGCYREVSMQTYPLNPYLSYMIVRQISSKVKKGYVPAFDFNYFGYFCMIANMESKHVGRTSMMVRNTFVSTSDNIQSIFDLLNLQVDSSSSSSSSSSTTTTHYVVVNEACIPVTKQCFDKINLHSLKHHIKFIECFQDVNFIIIRYKMGLLFKQIYCSCSDDKKIWVTSRDQTYWNILFESENTNKLTFANLTSYFADLNPFFNFNVFTKNILGFNTLKNAVLATDKIYSEYFMETFSAYIHKITPYHKVVCEPVDEFSSHFVLRIPLVKVAYMSFKGMNQEDCIIVREDLRVFDCVRFYTVRMKFETPSPYVTFYPMRGDSFPDDAFIGHLVCHERNSFEIVPQTTHVKLVLLPTHHENTTIYKIYFSKPNFKYVNHCLTENRLSISLKQKHVSGTGDKLCSFHGQKGVMHKMGSLPMFGKEQPDIIVNPYSMFRMTLGQIKEGLYHGGKDEKIIRNSSSSSSHGQRMQCKDGIFFAKTFYFPVAYWASEHIYAPKECVMDKILGQAVKGRSRGGGMRLGNMEIMNGLRGNGLGNCYEEKVVEHGDRIFYNKQLPLPKSTLLCQEDAKFFKCHLDFTMEPCIKKMKNVS